MLPLGFVTQDLFAGELMNGGNAHCCSRSSSSRPMTVQADLRSSCWLTRLRLKDTVGCIAVVEIPIVKTYPRTRVRRLSRTQSAAVGKLPDSNLPPKTVSTADIPCPKVQPIQAERPARIWRRLSIGFWGTCSIAWLSHPRVWLFALCAEYLLPSCIELPDPE